MMKDYARVRMYYVGICNDLVYVHITVRVLRPT